MKEERFSDAHPSRMTQIEEEDDASKPPTIQQLEGVINVTFRGQRSNQNKKKVGIAVVNLLGKLSFDQGQGIIAFEMIIDIFFMILFNIMSIFAQL